MGAVLCPSLSAQAPDPSGEHRVMRAIRRRVPNDHSCLFWAISYLAECADCGRTKAQELRNVCAQDALSDPDPSTKALLLGFDSIGEYANWIRNDFHWGGENEIVCLAKHYKVEVAVVSCESMRVTCYGSDLPDCTGRIYLLYTGSHYDAIVAGEDGDVPVERELKRQKKGDESLDSSALELARQQNIEAERKAKQKRVKKIKCKGCGALLSDNDAFATHCQEVEHDDDFAYECEEVDVVYEAGDELPEGTIDLNSDSVHSFSNTGKDPLCNAFPAVVVIDGISYPTLEHYWQAARFLGTDDTVVKQVAAAPTVDEAVMVATGAGPNSQRLDWQESRKALLLAGLRAKAAQCPAFVAALLETGTRTVVALDQDSWAGMTAPGGIPSGQNNIGEALMELRKELEMKS